MAEKNVTVDCKLNEYLETLPEPEQGMTRRTLLKSGALLGGSAGDDAASQSSHDVTAGCGSQRQPTTVATPATRAASMPRTMFSGPTNTTAAPESLRM